VFAICAALRLARFNVMIEDPDRPAWAANYFVGVPAPAGAITVLLPIYVQFLGMPHFDFVAPVALLYTLGIAFLMVSRLPVFSGKRVGKRVAPEMVLPVFVLIVLFFALLISYPWEVLTIGTVIYVVTLPLGWISYREARRKTAAAAAGDSREATKEATPAAVTPAVGNTPTTAPQPSPPLAGEHPSQPERPTRLN
jgi:CDP-diacylglycerol--serine O-phosphatidyltransferase